MKRSSDWTLSSSDDDDDSRSILPSSQSHELFSSPSRIKEKLLNMQKSVTTKSLPMCPFGEDCYRKNPTHFLEYSHPKEMKSSLSTKGEAGSSSCLATEDDVPTKKIKLNSNKELYVSKKSDSDPLKVWESSAPSYFLLTTCSGIPRKYNYMSRETVDKKFPPSLGICDILSEKFGNLKQSVQFNYCIDVEWLMAQYPKSFRSKPLLVVHGEQGGNAMRLRAEAEPYPNIQLCRVDLPPYGTHHTKMMLLLYEEGLRVVISTANLVEQDWSQKSQGLFMSPIFPPASGSECEFQSDLIEYLTAYQKSLLHPWITIIKNHDMTSTGHIRLVGSVPGRHTGSCMSSWGHMRLRKLLRSKVKRIDTSWPVIGQFSSIGSLGLNENKWLCNEWLTSMTSCDPGKFLGRSSSKSPLKLVFPTVDNVRCSLAGYPAGASLPYSASNAKKQKWLQSFLHQWKSDHAGRTEASPHIKSYTRISPFDTNVRLPWFLLTSANLSKAAWGALEKNSTQLAIKSFELGVLFIPNDTKDLCFHIDSESEHKNRFYLPYSLPLAPYRPDDQPWTWDAPHTEAPDRYGNVWVPS